MDEYNKNSVSITIGLTFGVGDNRRAKSGVEGAEGRVGEHEKRDCAYI